jgi:uncharacterized SAM-binding protein YcdF (DUF218 family)
MHTADARPSVVRGFLRWTGIAVLLVVAYMVVTFLQVWTAATQGQPEPAGAIVVLGAAQYDGRPSPVLQARLDHAVGLFEQGVAPVVVVTGSNRPGDRTTEATASANYLHARGVSHEVIRREVDGRNTWEQLAATARFLRAEDITDVVLVSDPLHSYRLELTARELGLRSQVSPRTVRISTLGERARNAVRETVAVSVGRVVSFRRLRNLQNEILNPRPVLGITAPVHAARSPLHGGQDTPGS